MERMFHLVSYLTGDPPTIESAMKRRFLSSQSRSQYVGGTIGWAKMLKTLVCLTD
jgi:hypothetical protein